MTPAKAPIPFLGTWKQTKCECSRPDLPHPTSALMTATQESDGIHMNSKGVWSDGREAQMSAVYQMDGKWYPVTGSLVADSVSLRIVDGSSAEAKLRKGGTDIGTQRITVSADGRTLTARIDIAGPGGAPINWTTTSERQ